MEGYTSVMYSTSNENGRQELVLERPFSVTGWIAYTLKHRTLNVPYAHTETFELIDGDWVNKETGKLADCEMQFTCDEAKYYVQKHPRT